MQRESDRTTPDHSALSSQHDRDRKAAGRTSNAAEARVVESTDSSRRSSKQPSVLHRSTGTASSCSINGHRAAKVAALTATCACAWASSLVSLLSTASAACPKTDSPASATAPPPDQPALVLDCGSPPNSRASARLSKASSSGLCAARGWVSSSAPRIAASRAALATEISATKTATEAAAEAAAAASSKSSSLSPAPTHVAARSAARLEDSG